MKSSNKGFWFVIAVACIPVVIGSFISILTSKATMLSEMSTKCAVMDEKISSNKELLLSLMSESEKRRTEQYQYLCKETDEIKEQLKQKKNIAMGCTNELEISPDIMYLVKRGSHASRWIDSLHKYTEVNDSLYITICQNLSDINKRLN
ncbi:MAG: hypothetical protein WC238_04605 [Parcubacteria group bacterium]